jgi:flagellar biosynthetic protein FlhB
MSQAGERTEEATPRRKEKAREDGKVLTSRYFLIAVHTAAGIWAWENLVATPASSLSLWRAWVREAFHLSTNPEGLLQHSVAAANCVLLGLLPILGATWMASLSAHLLLTGGYFSFKGLQPKPQKIFSPGKLKNQWGEGLKAVFFGLLVLAAVAVGCLAWGWDALLWLAQLPRLTLASGVQQSADALGGGGTQILIGFGLIGALDYLLSKRKLHNQLKMTKQEVKEEYKESNGNPEVKGRIRRLMREMAGRRMMADVPKATVVITNPTHYAIAIRYEAGSMAVPKILAKGVDHTALRIRMIAILNQIPVVENPPLAQALYKTAEVGDEIPMHLYRAVAEVLAYVYRILGRTVAG